MRCQSKIPSKIAIFFENLDGTILSYATDVGVHRQMRNEKEKELHLYFQILLFSLTVLLGKVASVSSVERR